MVIAVSAGVVLAAFLFMGRMADTAGVNLLEGGEHPHLKDQLPRGVVLYEIAGPLFFGAAEKAMTALHRIDEHIAAIIIDLGGVPAIDVTGIIALESAIERLHADAVFVALAGVQGQPARALNKANVVEIPGKLVLASSPEQALLRVRQHLGLDQSGPKVLTEAIT